MINRLYIKDFKCFDEIEIELSKLNLFSGTNSSGKSSAIQALLLLSNNATGNAASVLNWQWLRIGSFDEAKNFNRHVREFEIGAESDGDRLILKFEEDNENEGLAACRTVSESDEISKQMALQNKHIFYLPATRPGPEDFYSKNFDRINSFGNNAEFVVDFLARNQKQNIAPSLIADPSSKTLLQQVNFWLRKIFNVGMQIEEMGITNFYSVKYSYGNNKYVRPYHIGTGISYVLGLLVMSLTAKNDDIIIIENPEIHLHPKAQSEISEFLCFVSNAGIQVIIESHSDHIFNGIRKSIAKKQIANKDVAIHFFELDENFNSKNYPIQIEPNGRLSNFRKGLFDQFDDDLDQLLGL